MGPFVDRGGWIGGLVAEEVVAARGRRRARRPPRRGSGGSPAAPAGRSGCGRPAPPSAGRRCRARAGSTTAGRAPGGGRSTRRRRSPGRRRDPAARGRRRASPSAGRAPPAGRAGRRSGPGWSVAASRPPGRSRTSRSTERPASSAPPMARPSSSVSGVMTTSHSRRTPRATASTGSKLRDRSSQATIEPWAWASAASRRTSVVRPLEPSPRIATLADRGRPPGPRIASSAANPVRMTRSSGSGRGSVRGADIGRVPRADAGAGASASAPSVIRGAAAPQRAWRLATAAVTSGERVAIGRSRLEHLFYQIKGRWPASAPSARGPSPRRHASGLASLPYHAADADPARLADPRATDPRRRRRRQDRPPRAHLPRARRLQRS